MSQRIVVCGAGEVGTHIAELLAGKENSVVVIDSDANRIASLDHSIDVSTITGSCSNAVNLKAAIGSGADLLVACTQQDEVNLLTCALAKKMGVQRTVARVEHRVFFDSTRFDYAACLGIDGMICPDYSTARAISRLIRNPGAVAIDDFGQDTVEMQEFEVTANAPTIGLPLKDITMPPRTQLVAMRRNGKAFIPDATTIMQNNDHVVLVGNADVVQSARRLFHPDEAAASQVVIMGGTAVAVWLCRSLPKRQFKIRLFEPDRDRAVELGAKLDWVTVIQEDVIDPTVFEEERVGKADVFVACADDDEQNILTCVWAKSKGTRSVVAVSGRTDYLSLLKQIGIDYAVSPRNEAAETIDAFLDLAHLQKFSTLEEGKIDVYRATVGPKSKLIGKSLAESRRSNKWIISAIRRGDESFVPIGTDTIEVGDSLVAVGSSGLERKLASLFDAHG